MAWLNDATSSVGTRCGLLADLPGEWQCGTIGFAFEICNEAGELLDIVKFEDAAPLLLSGRTAKQKNMAPWVGGINPTPR